jgi:hypothetical protein
MVEIEVMNAGERRTYDRPMAGRLVLLVPWKQEGSFLREQVDDLAQAPGAVVREPGRVPLSSLGRMPSPVARAAAWVAARVYGVSDCRALAIFHRWQVPYALAVLDRSPGAELWYGVWDLYPRRSRAATTTTRS